MGATLEDVARRANVSHMTVSLVLNNKSHKRVSVATRERVLQAARDVGYSPNLAALALAKGRTRTIALWVMRISMANTSRIIGAFENLLLADGYEWIVRGIGIERTSPAEWPVDGIIGVDNAYCRPIAPEEFRNKQTPFVSIDAYYDSAQDYVCMDLYPAAQQAVHHLWEQGCRRIAHMLISPDNVETDVRRRAYLSAVQQLGQEPEIIVLPDDRRASVAPVLQDYVVQHGCPDGLFCRNDELAIGAYITLRKMGLRVPEDVCIVGCDGIIDTEYLETPLTTLVKPVEEMCAQAWSFLGKRMCDPTLPQQTSVLQAQLVIRQSSLRRGE